MPSKKAVVATATSRPSDRAKRLHKEAVLIDGQGTAVLLRPRWCRRRP